MEIRIKIGRASKSEGKTENKCERIKSGIKIDVKSGK
jgi:hypothetical protein